jgi:hypothetical protein
MRENTIQQGPSFYWDENHGASLGYQCINGGSVNVICEAASYESNSFQIIGYTPLPSTWTMLIVGYFGLGFFAYRGSKKKAAAIAAA